MTRLSPIQIEQIRELAERAATCAMSFYHSDYQVTLKNDDSPVTQADFAVSGLLEVGLPAVADFPVLSEENKPDEPKWLDWETYWLVDPIDGTRHFINGSGEFCICIALIHQHRPVFGLISAPNTGEVWLGQVGDKENPASLTKYQLNNVVTLPCINAQQPLTVTLGTQALSARMKVLLAELPHYHFYTRGSALKFIDLVEGRANLYPKMWDICEWDCAAGQCLLQCAGGEMLRFDSDEPIRYGTKSDVLSPHFIAHRGLTSEMIRGLRKMYPKVPPFKG